LAQERERRLLPLAAVRPVPAFVALTGRWLALCALAALSLAVSAAVTYCQADLRPDCRLHLAPVLPPPAVAAAQALDALFGAGHLTLEEYVSLLDGHSALPKGKLEQILQARQEPSLD
jgi:ABC-type Na+ efflux pump permease subunit